MGFNVKIGCGKFTFNNIGLLINCLDEYLRNPEEWEKKYGELSPDVVAERPERVPPQPTASEAK